MGKVLVFAIGLALGLICLAMAGIAGFIAALCIMVVIWRYSGLRGLLAVRAYVFLSELNSGAEPEEANQTAMRVDAHAASYIAPMAMQQAKMMGGQLAMISLARLNGFRN